ncbi:hypothetical protein BOTBODRAFT_105228 [Botryobasidium botryosum FD-172 SS1]|uniref:3'-5' exonuclease domain-containing protein n=1 Tax=Botryobasidium botryosum (strain FD-172 SS1) TaxID=930990 RepID=A0A067N0P5_BOTB1|nr:hypothetical protein BOTBODRAFT_105228 [Botryobasidium botryosum FD-172 SS1]
MADFSLCDTPSKLDAALVELRSATHIALDCEGQNLGQEGGKLSLISVSPISLKKDSPPIFLVDAVALDDRTLAPLFDLLRSNKPIKVVFDGRMDYSELAYRHGAQINGVLDLQLADIRSRTLRGESREGQLKRLSPYLHRGQVGGQPSAYASVHRLNGLESCAREHGVRTTPKLDGPFIHDNWMKRPLRDDSLEYAARDIRLLAGVYACFQEKSYMDECDLLLQSQKYVSLWDAPPRSHDTYKSHPLLPLDILQLPSSREALVECVGCKRRLTTQSFSKTGLRLPSKRRCWVCLAVSVQQHTKQQWDRDDDLDCEYSDEYSGFGDSYGNDSYHDFDRDNYGYDGDW